MNRLDTLLPDITKMSQDELMEFIRGVRKDRKVNKRAAKVSGTSKQRAVDKLDKLLGGMSPEEVGRLKDAWANRDKSG